MPGIRNNNKQYHQTSFFDVHADAELARKSTRARERASDLRAEALDSAPARKRVIEKRAAKLAIVMAELKLEAKKLNLLLEARRKFGVQQRSQVTTKMLQTLATRKTKELLEKQREECAFAPIEPERAAKLREEISKLADDIEALVGMIKFRAPNGANHNNNGSNHNNHYLRHNSNGRGSNHRQK